MEITVFPKQRGETNTPAGRTEALGVTLIPQPSELRFCAVFPQILPPAAVAQPLRMLFTLFSGWGMGGNWVSPSPAPSELTFSPN